MPLSTASDKKFYARILLLICLTGHSSLVLSAPPPEPVKSCPRHLLDWATARWKWLAGGAVVAALTGYGIYEAVRAPDAPALVAGDPNQNIPAPGRLEAWQLKHANSSPLLALNRKTEWKLERELVEAVGSGKPTELSFAEPFWHEGKRIKEVELNDALDETGVEKAETRGYSESDRKKVEAIAEHVKQSKPTELVLVHVGATHALDYYLRHPAQGARYAAYPWNGSVPEARKLGLTVYLTHLLRISDYKKENAAFDLKAAFEEKPLRGNVILIGSLSGTRDTAVIEDLPTAESLRAAGFTSVTILVEGLPVRPEPYTFDDVRDKPLHPDSISLVDKARVWNSTVPVKIHSLGK